MDLHVGGAYRITFQMPGGELWSVRGVYRELRPPERIVCTWAWEEDDPALEKETLLTLEFVARGDATELILTHEAFRDAGQRDRHEGGWKKILAQLDGPMHPFAIRGLDVSGYMVKDAPRAIAFYRDVLGLTPTRLYPEDRGAEYDLADGTTFCLWGGGGRVMPFQPSNGNLFAVDDLAAAVAALKARGIPIVMERQTPNCAMAAIDDSEGNMVILHERKPAV